MRSFYKPLVFQLLVERDVAFVAGAGDISVFHRLDYFAALLAEMGTFGITAGGEQRLEFSEAGDERVTDEFGDLGRLEDTETGGICYECAVKGGCFAEGIEGYGSRCVLSSLYFARLTGLEGKPFEHCVHKGGFSHSALSCEGDYAALGL